MEDPKPVPAPAPTKPAPQPDEAPQMPWDPEKPKDC